MPSQQENYSGNQLDLIREGYIDGAWNEVFDYIRLSVYRSTTETFIGRFYSNKVTLDGGPQVIVYPETGLSVKPNEILEANYVAGGDYKLEFDFLRDIFSYYYTGDPEAPTFLYGNPKFVITEISATRKEVRLVAKNFSSDTSTDIDLSTVNFQSVFEKALTGAPVTDVVSAYTADYTYDWVLEFERDKNISVNAYTFDSISDNNKTTLILRLDKPLPPKFKKLNKIKLSRELINTQTQNILYVSNIKSIYAGQGLTPDKSVWDDQVVYDQDVQQNYQQLIETASFTENNLQDVYRNQNDDINLNIDYSDFKNHTLFGSVKSKLTNFKTKVGNIQGHLNVVSNSLSLDHHESSSYIAHLRTNAFNKIQAIQNTFTPYERWLYFDGQNESTSSAPGIGKNYAKSMPVTNDAGDNHTILLNYEGIKSVHKHEPLNSADGGSAFVDLFSGKYYAEQAPFYNYSSSIYLSFLMKANTAIKNSSGATGSFTWENRNHNETVPIPEAAFQKTEVQVPANITSSKYQRVILKAQQYGWRPYSGSFEWNDGDRTPRTADDDGVISTYYISGSLWTTTEGNNKYWHILSSSQQVVSASMSGSIGNGYPIRLHTDDYANLGTNFTGSDVPFTGSILPSGELFRIYWKAPNFNTLQDTASFVTDIKISLKDPTNALPFSFIYPTGSTEFDNWYTQIYNQASQYDENNIHSLYKNVPEKVVTGSNEIQTFINVWGEHFDGVRNYIDTYKTFYKRSYKSSDSVPSNLLPVLGDNLGWELINPFSSSLKEYFSDLSTGSLENSQDITNNTWRKIVNNLVYIYKSKGTQNSLRALLNIYGYPPDLISVSEFGGSMEEHNPVIIDNTYTTFNTKLNSLSGNISFVQEPKLYTMMNFKSNNSDKLVIPWNEYQGTAISASNIEFTMQPYKSKVSMSIFEAYNNYGTSGQELRWDLNYVPNSLTSGKLLLRIHPYNKATGSLTNPGGKNNAFTASTGNFDVGNGKMYNVNLQNSLSPQTNGPRDYEHSSANQGPSFLLTVSSIDGDGSIKTMLTSSIFNTDVVLSSVFDVANSLLVEKNFITTGSNLYVGRTFNGNLSDIKYWRNPQSASKMKQHTLNPTSIVGNNVNSTNTDLVLRYRLNENYPSGSVSSSIKIKDSNPNFEKDYSIVSPFNIDESTYNSRLINITKFIPRTDGFSHKNTNMITTDMDRGFMSSNLNPSQKSFMSNFNPDSTNSRKTSTVVEFTKSPTDAIDDYITQISSDKDITQYFAKWSDLFEPYYEDLDDLRDKIMSGTNIDINTYISAQARLFNPFILEAINAVVPGRVRLREGVELKPSILERTKIEYKKAGLQRLPLYDTNISDMWIFDTEYVIPYYGSFKDSPDFDFNFVTPYKTEITTEEMYDYSMDYISILKSNNLNIYKDSIEYSINLVNNINSNILNIIKENNNLEILYIKPYDSNIINLYKDIIEYQIQLSDIIQSNILDLYRDIVTYSILYSKIYESNILKTINSGINYTINYLKIYNTSINESAYKTLGVNIATETGSSYMELFKASLQEANYQNFEMKYLVPTSSKLSGWPLQDLGFNWIDIINTNIQDPSFQLFTWEYLNLIETNLSEWQYQSLTGNYIRIYESKLQRWPFDDLSSTFLSVMNTELKNWKYQDFSFSYLSLIDTNLKDWNYQSFATQFLKIYNTSLDNWHYQSFDMKYLPLSIGELTNWNYQSFDLKYLSILNTTLDKWMYQSFGVDYLPTVDGKLSNWNYQTFSMENVPIKEFSISNHPYQTLDMKYITPIETSSTELADIYWVNPKQSPLKTWGTSSNDTHIMNMAFEGSSGDYNTGYYNDVVINYMIGDMEYISESRASVQCPNPADGVTPDVNELCLGPSYCDPHDYRCHTNNFVYDDGITSDVYQAYGGNIKGSNPIKGKPIGRTSFVATASNGDLIYPTNHWKNFHTTKDQLRYLFYESTPTSIIAVDDNNNFHETTIGRGHWPTGKDLFINDEVYSIKVDGSDTENILKVQKTTDRPGKIKGKPSLGAGFENKGDINR